MGLGGGGEQHALCKGLSLSPVASTKGPETPQPQFGTACLCNIRRFKHKPKSPSSEKFSLFVLFLALVFRPDGIQAIQPYTHEGMRILNRRLIQTLVSQHEIVQISPQVG